MFDHLIVLEYAEWPTTWDIVWYLSATSNSYRRTAIYTDSQSNHELISHSPYLKDIQMTRYMIVFIAPMKGVGSGNPSLFFQKSSP
jgi:hypothetical protein